jgi:hypothetical protein
MSVASSIWWVQVCIAEMGRGGDIWGFLADLGSRGKKNWFGQRWKRRSAERVGAERSLTHAPPCEKTPTSRKKEPCHWDISILSPPSPLLACSCSRTRRFYHTVITVCMHCTLSLSRSRDFYSQSAFRITSLIRPFFKLCILVLCRDEDLFVQGQQTTLKLIFASVCWVQQSATKQ